MTLRLIRILLLFISLWGGVLLGGMLVEQGVWWPVFLAMVVAPLGTYSLIYRRQEGHWPNFSPFSDADRELMRRHPPGQPPRRLP